MSFPALKTERLSLRKLSLSDAQAINQLRSAPETARLTGKEPFTSINDAIVYIQKIERLFDDNACVFWEIGYELLPEFQK